MPERTLYEEIQEVKYAWGKLMEAVLDEFKAPLNLAMRCLLKVCDWLED
jgi:hypothetical protein